VHFAVFFTRHTNTQTQTQTKFFLFQGRWERRAPLAPRHVAELVKRGLSVLIQPSTLRTYSDKKYEEVPQHQKHKEKIA
jgi:hypothetical protein